MRKMIFTFTCLLCMQQLFAQCNGFYDGFESGSLAPTWTSGTGTFTATTTQAAQGNYGVMGTGSSSHLQGLSASFPAQTPETISWYIRPQGTASTNYVVIGDNSMTASNCIVFAYWRGAGSELRFVASGINQNISLTANQWHKVEMRNIDWTARTFDIYVNNTLEATAFPFRTTTQSTATQVHLYNFNAGTSYWDEILFDDRPIIEVNSTDASCFGQADGQADISIVAGPAPPYDYLWSDGQTTAVATGLAPGNYQVTVSSGGSVCAAEESFTISEPAELSITAAATINQDLQCWGGNDAIRSVSVQGGVPPYSYAWTGGQTTQTATGLSAGNYTCTASDAGGCSINLDFLISQPMQITGTDMQTACGSFTWINGLTYTSNTSLVSHPLTAANGCDSLVWLELTVSPNSNTTDTRTACGSFTWIDGNTYTSSNTTATYRLSSSNGCDSIITLDLTLNPGLSSTDSHVACGSFTWIDGNTYTSSNTTASITVPSSTSCDSTITLDLQLDEFVAADVTVGPNGFEAVNLNGDSYQWLDCNNGNAPIPSATSPSFMPSDPNGLYALRITSGSCQSTSPCLLISNTSLLAEKAGMKLYPNPNKGQFTLELGYRAHIYISDALGRRVFEGFYNAGQEQIQVPNLAPGFYILRAQPEDGSPVEQSSFIIRN